MIHFYIKGYRSGTLVEKGFKKSGVNINIDIKIFYRSMEKSIDKLL